MQTSTRDLMTVNQIANELDKLIMSLKTADMDASDKDFRDLEDARDLLQKFADESSDEKPTSSAPDMASTDVVKPVNTGVLTGPMPALKNFLVQRQRDNEAQ